MPEMLSLKGVHSGYGETVVLENVDLELPQRGSLAVLGRNGVGKTTLLATIMGHTTFHSGKVEFNRRQIADHPVYERCRLGIGTPSTGIGVLAASTPARWAAPPAPAIRQTRPRPAASDA